MALVPCGQWDGQGAHRARMEQASGQRQKPGHGLPRPPALPGSPSALAAAALAAPPCHHVCFLPADARHSCFLSQPNRFQGLQELRPSPCPQARVSSTSLGPRPIVTAVGTEAVPSTGWPHPHFPDRRPSGAGAQVRSASLASLEAAWGALPFLLPPALP